MPTHSPSKAGHPMSLHRNCLESLLKPRFLGPTAEFLSVLSGYEGVPDAAAPGTIFGEPLLYAMGKGTAVFLVGPSFSFTLSQDFPSGRSNQPFTARTDVKLHSGLRERKASSPDSPRSPLAYPCENSDSCNACATCKGAGPCETGF